MLIRNLRCIVLAPVLAFVAFAGCSGGNGTISNTIANVTNSITSSVAGPTDFAQVVFLNNDMLIPRAQFGRANNPASLALQANGQVLLNGQEMSTFITGMNRFNTDFTPADGLGPYFNDRVCLGCHQASGTFGPTFVPTAFARAQRGSAFTVFGDYSPAAGTFNPLVEFGGPFFHERTVNGAPPQVMPPESQDPFILNAGAVRATGLRAGPPYIGRGFMEAVPNAEIVRYDDPFDADADGISGRHNENHEDIAFVGGSPVNRLARFGVKGGGPTLLQFMLGGLCNQFSITTPFCPTESLGQTQAGNYDPVPDPEITEQVVYDLRSFIRMLSIPQIDAAGYATPAPAGFPDPFGIGDFGPTNAAAIANAAFLALSSQQRGALLFGCLLGTGGLVPGTNASPTPGPNRNGMARDLGRGRGIHCATCHVPFMTTGVSPAEIGGRLLSHRTFPIFCDMLLHDMGANLADNVRIAPITGLATSREFRTAPITGAGLTIPPFFHDSRGGTAGQTPDEAMRQCIQLHDNNGADSDSEGNASTVAFRQLPRARQDDVVAFVRSL